MSTSYTCNSCGVSVKTLKSYVQHQGLHRNEAHYLYPCCIANCKSRFRNYSTFKCHIYRHHRQTSSVSQCESLQGPFTCKVANCHKQLIDLSDLLGHLKFHISKREAVHCPFNNCDHSFSVKSSFTSHLSRKHKNSTALHVSGAYCLPSVSSESQFSVAESHSDERANDVVTDDDGPEEDMLDPSQIKSLYIKNLSMFYMKLQAKYLIPSSTIQLIVEEIDKLSGVCQQYTKNHLKVSLQAKAKLSETEIEDVLKTLDDMDIHGCCRSALSTEHKRKQYFEEHFPYVHQKCISLGIDKNRKERHAQYIPIKDTLTALLKDPAVWEECRTSRNESTPLILNDVSDGSVFKSNPLFLEPELTLKVILYQDAFEVVNPLGSARKKHKLLGVYFTLANFDPFHRSTIDNMQLLLLCREADFKYFGHEKVFSPLISDFKELETNGLNIHGNNVKATVFCIAGDNLGSHNIGGFTENFSTSNYFCRYCHVTRSELENMEYQAPIRTVQNYNVAVAELQNDNVSEVKGVKFDSVFNSLAFFHVCQPGLPPCIGHDLFEGVVASDLALYLNCFVKVKKFFTYSELNRRIRQFTYKGSDSNSTPSEVSEKGTKLGGQATENWCLLRLLPVIIGEKITDTDDPVWQLTIQLKEVVELICAPKISIPQIALLNVQIHDYLETRKEMFPAHKLKPKHHFLTHYPALILKFGPLMRLCTMRFESKHSYFKRCVRRTQNFKNVCQTLARNHQLLQAYLHSGSFFPPSMVVKNSTPFHAELYNNAVRTAVGTTLDKEPNIVASTEIQWKGTLYKKGFFLCLSPRESNEFGQIELILVKEERHVYFIVTPHDVSYLPEFGLYEVKEAKQSMKCVNAELTLDYYPLSAYTLFETKVISLKHSVVDTE